MGIRSLQWRLVFIFISITLSLMLFVGVVLIKQVETSYYETFKKDIEKSFNDLESDLKTSNDLLNDLKENIKDKYKFPIMGNYRSYSIIDARTSKIIVSSATRFNDKSQKETFEKEIYSSKNLLAALAGNKAENEGKLIQAEGKAFFDYARRIGDYVVYFRYDKEEWIDTISKFNKIILFSSVFAVIASLIIGFILSKAITVPIASIMHKANKLAQGDFDQVLEVKTTDEIGNLAKTFNYMANELKNKLVEISSEKNKIETILNYMTDGVIAFNLKGEIIHANPAFENMMGNEYTRKSFNEFTQNYSVDISLEEILYLEARSTKTFNIATNDKYIKIHFAVFTDEEHKVEGIIAVLHDITEQQKLENMRREFVANVSHELRTPLTSIKSYAETLLDGAMDDKEIAERFLGVINSEADRMTRLVKDLLQLSRLDNSRMKLNMQGLSLVELTKNSIEKIQLEANNKEQVIESFVIGDIPEIKADRDRLEQVVLNILTNAIKYTPSGGKITVYIGKFYSEVYLKISDTGIGIPQQDLPRIFERFYRVDKARSREMGGTGLGLAIAKEIVDAHKGQISINSEFEKGTEVTVKLPICN